jgi:NAD(P)H-dependent FMN reductase
MVRNADLDDQDVGTRISGPTPVQILGISGSLREASTNTRLLVAATLLAPAGVEIRLTSSVARLPLFSPDLEPADLHVVDQWVREMRAADGIIVSTPEYAGGYPGALKNAFDWLVGTDAYVDKPFMLLKASPRSSIAQQTFAKVLETMSGVHIERASTTIPLLGTKLTVSEIVDNREFAERIRESVLTFVSEVRKRRSRSDDQG